MPFVSITDAVAINRIIIVVIEYSGIISLKVIITIIILLIISFWLSKRIFISQFGISSCKIFSRVARSVVFCSSCRCSLSPADMSTLHYAGSCCKLQTHHGRQRLRLSSFLSPFLCFAMRCAILCFVVVFCQFEDFFFQCYCWWCSIFLSLLFLFHSCSEHYHYSYRYQEVIHY